MQNNLTAGSRSPFGSSTIVQNDEETLVIDARSGFTPSEHVEQRLIVWLKSSPVLVSHIQRQLKPRFQYLPTQYKTDGSRMSEVRLDCLSPRPNF